MALERFTGRREDDRLLTGQGRYTADWSLPGQLYGYFLRSDHAHALIKRINTAAARAPIPGLMATTWSSLERSDKALMRAWSHSGGSG